MPTILAAFLRGAGWALGAILLTTGLLQAQPADWLIQNALIYTGNPAQPTAQSMSIRGSRILSVGQAAAADAGLSTRRVDLKGLTIVPGFIDSHGHMAGLGEMLETVNLRGQKSVSAIARQVRSASAKLPKGQWIRGRAWDQTAWDGAFPTKAALDQAAPDHPVYLARVDGHAAWVNSRALEMADINRATADPDGGRIVRDASGQPTGILIDRAQSLVASKIPARTPEQVEKAIALAAKECVRVGLTGVHDAGIGALELAAYRKLLAQDKLPLRIYAMIDGGGGAGPLWEELRGKGPEIGERFTLRSIKLMADGAMGSRGAAFLDPYSDDPGNTGLLMLSQEAIANVAREAIAQGFQVNTHAIGDRANRTVLRAYASVLNGKNEKRFRIEHAQVVHPSDVRLFAENSVIASIQSTHATSDRRWAEQRIGKIRLDGAWRAQSFVAADIRIANGSDFPVEQTNPLLGFYAAVTREGFLPREKLTREQALHSWTWGGAYAAFEEKDKGSLEPGKLADFVVLTQDIMTIPAAEILRTGIKMTIVGGQIVYEAP